MRGKVKNYLRKACDFLQGTYLLTAAAPRALFSDCDFTDRTDWGSFRQTGIRFIRFIRVLILWRDRFLGPRILRIERKTLRKALGRVQKVFGRFQKPLRRFRKAPGRRVTLAERAHRGRGTVEPRARNARVAPVTRWRIRTWKRPYAFAERTNLVPAAANGLHTALPGRDCRGGAVYKRRWAVRQIASTNLQMASRSALSSSRNFSTLRRASLRSE